MTIHVDIWLRGDDFATTEAIPDIAAEPGRWTESEVRQVLEGMLRAMHRLKHPKDPERYVSLRGLSWIVNPYEDGGVVIAIEITLGAAIAGPIDIDQATLEALITRVLARPAPATTPTVH